MATVGRPSAAARCDSPVSSPITTGDRASVAARYRLVMENGEPVVRVAFLCEGEPKHCARDRKMVMKGLPFAKAR